MPHESHAFYGHLLASAWSAFDFVLNVDIGAYPS